MQLLKYTTLITYHESLSSNTNEDWMYAHVEWVCRCRKGYIRREQRRDMMDMIEYYDIYDTMSNMAAYYTLIDTIPLCQKARHQRDSCRRHYQSQKQRQMPYPLQAMILYCQCQRDLHLLFHKERVFHQKPWLKDTSSYVGVSEISCWSSTNKSSKHKKYKYIIISLPQSPYCYWGERQGPLNDKKSSWYACCLLLIVLVSFVDSFPCQTVGSI